MNFHDYQHYLQLLSHDHLLYIMYNNEKCELRTEETLDRRNIEVKEVLQVGRTACDSCREEALRSTALASPDCWVISLGMGIRENVSLFQAIPGAGRRGARQDGLRAGHLWTYGSVVLEVDNLTGVVHIFPLNNFFSWSCEPHFFFTGWRCLDGLSIKQHFSKFGKTATNWTFRMAERYKNKFICFSSEGCIVYIQWCFEHLSLVFLSFE